MLGEKEGEGKTYRKHEKYFSKNVVRKIRKGGEENG